MRARSPWSKTRASKRGWCVSTRLSASARSTTSLPSIEVAPFEVDQRGHDLLRELARPTHAALPGARPDAGEPDVESLAARRHVGEPVLVLAAQVDAEHAAAVERADHPADAVRGALEIHAAAAAAAALGKDEHRLAPVEKVDEPIEHGRHLAAIAATRDRYAFHQV